MTLRGKEKLVTEPYLYREHWFDTEASSSINGLTFPHDYVYRCKCPFDRVTPTGWCKPIE